MSNRKQLRTLAHLRCVFLNQYSQLYGRSGDMYMLDKRLILNINSWILLDYSDKLGVTPQT